MTSTVMDIGPIKQAVRRGRNVDTAWVVGLAITCPLILFIAIWLTTGFGRGPTRFLVLGGAGVVLAVVLITAAVASRASVLVRLLAVIFAFVTVPALSYWSLSAGLVAFKIDGYVASWQQTLKALPLSSNFQPVSSPGRQLCRGSGTSYGCARFLTASCSTAHRRERTSSTTMARGFR